MDVNYTINCSYGNYILLEPPHFIPVSKLYYCLTSASYKEDNPDDKMIVNIILDMTTLPMKDIYSISVIDITGESVLSLIYDEKNIFHLRFKLNEILQGTDIIIKFNSHYNKLIYKKIIQLPLLEIIGDNEKCAICWDNIDENSGYITTCRHFFHLKCFIEYAVSVSEKAFKNKDGSANSMSLLNVEKCKCPMCNTEIFI